MKIAITGVTGFRNRGVEALVKPIVDGICDTFPSAQIQIASLSPSYDQKRISTKGVRFIEDAFWKGGTWCPPLILSRSLHARIQRKVLNGVRRAFSIDSNTRTELRMPFESPDLVIVSGGDLFSSDYGTGSLKHFIQPILWAKANNIPCILLGQSIGKFTNPDDIQLWRLAEQSASAITLREELSLEYLSGELQSARSLFKVSADTAFLLKPDTTLADQYFAGRETPTIALSISESICQYTGNDYKKHFETWIQVIRMMLDDWKVSIAIIPHVHEAWADDRILSTRIVRELGFDPRIRVFAEDLSAAEYKGIISKCDMVVAERMHAAIAGFSTGVCTSAVGYSIKAEGITAMMLSGSKIRASELSIPLDKFLDPGSAMKHLKGIWANRRQIETAIRENLPGSISQASENLSLACSFLETAKV